MEHFGATGSEFPKHDKSYGAHLHRKITSNILKTLGVPWVMKLGTGSY